MRRWGYALLAQGLAWLLAMMILESADQELHATFIEAFLAAVFAMLLSMLFKEPFWRTPMQGGFCLLVWVGLHFESIPHFLWLIALLMASLLFGGGITGRRAPLYLTQQKAFEGILSCIPENCEGKCLDVGAGIGSFILNIAPLRPKLIFEGIERAPLTCLLGNMRCKLHHAGAIQWGDLWKTSLQNYQVVYAFLSPEAMESLWIKARNEMPSGSLLIVNAFAIPNVKADQVIRYGNSPSDQILCYRLPGR
jgi:uncharacterized membrane protein YjjB (DUF3815 family)